MKRYLLTLSFCFLAFMASCAVISGGTRLYLNPNSGWRSDGARFSAYFFSASANAWVSMTAVSGTTYYVAEAPQGSWSNVIFCRMNGSTTANSWSNKWNQTGDLVYDGTKNLFTIASGVWDGATASWSVYDDGSQVEPTPTAYYVAGTMNDWSSDADVMTDGVRVYSNLSAGTYEFKITKNGSWDVNWGYESLDCSRTTIACVESGEYGGNISFTLTSATTVTIRFDGTHISVTVPGGIANCGGMGGAIDNYYVKPAMHDVMLQGFYYDAFGSSDAEFSYNTRWSTLNANAAALSKFDVIWLPPSAMAAGTGYHPKQWSNQNSDWGTAVELTTLINNLHSQGTKVMADVVVNHRDNKSSWCDFYPDNFGDYGNFQLTAEHICNDDEVNSGNNGCRATGNGDTGYTGVDPVNGVYGAWDGARDLDHTNAYVRQDVKAYLLWLKNEIGYDAWRWDMGKGFAPTYFNEYNYVSNPYMSVIEFWEGSVGTLSDFLNYCRPASDYNSSWDSANPGSMVFDFATKYQAINEGIGQGNYDLRGKGMPGAGISRYAVTFVDNHDTYRDGSCLAKVGDGERKILQSYAYILSMPGVPCVFYPHWKSFTSAINAMIDARHAVGVNSTSSVDDSETGDNTYRASVQGTNGYLILRLGADIYSHDPGSGYKIAAEGYGYRIYVPQNVILGDDPAGTVYYLTGNDLAGSWEPDAMAMTEGSISFEDLEPGTYTFKITTGSWTNRSYGFADIGTVSKSLTVSGDSDGNVVLTLAEQQDVTISMVNHRVIIASGKEDEQGVTYTVTVPDGTQHCYIVGDWNWSRFTEMTKVASNKFSITLDDNTKSMTYKYTCGPGWNYVEQTSAGEDIPNRSYTSSDVVERWKQSYSTDIEQSMAEEFYRLNGDVLTITSSEVVNVYDVIGRVVLSASASCVSQTLPAGIYLLRSGSRTAKVFVP